MSSPEIEIVRFSEKPKVTIGLCVRNCENSIKDAIESILSQDFPHRLMEVIFVDDGSTDRTPSIIREYMFKMDMNVKLFRHSWSGLGASRNIIIKNANGNYIVWIDGDMTIPSDHVRKQVEFMERNPKVGIAKAKYGLTCSKNIVEFLENVPFVIRYSKTNLSSLPGTGGAIFRLKAIRQAGGFDEKLFGAGEDLDMAYKVRSVKWLIKGSDAVFFEKHVQNWGKLWKKYVWYGYGNYYLYRKNKAIFRLEKMIPPAGFLTGIFYSFAAYRLTRRKIVFLLPLHFFFKSTAWCFGFLLGYIRSKKS